MRVLTPGLPFAAFVVAFAACDSGSTPASGELRVDTVAVEDTVVSTASALIGGATDLGIGADGRLYVADFGLKHVLSIRPDGTDSQVIGREGSGPGEFAAPGALAAAADTLWVFDTRRSDVQAFTLAGEYVRGYAVEAGSFGQGRALNRPGELALATGGLDSVLVTVVNAAGDRARSFGQPVAPAIRMWDFTSIRDRIRQGQVPDEFRNNALPVWAPDGSIFVAFYAEAEVRRYGPDGTLEWSRPLTDPVLARTRAAFIRKNRENDDPGLYPLRYVRDAQVVGGDLWLLLDTDEEDHGIMLVLDGSDGSVRRRLVLRDLPHAGPFAVDPERRRLYVVASDEAMLVALELS